MSPTQDTESTPQRSPVVRYIVPALLAIDLIVLILIGMLYPKVFDTIAGRTKLLFSAIVALLTFFGFVVNGVLKTEGKSLGEFLRKPEALIVVGIFSTALITFLILMAHDPTIFNPVAARVVAVVVLDASEETAEPISGMMELSILNNNSGTSFPLAQPATVGKVVVYDKIDDDVMYKLRFVPSDRELYEADSLTRKTLPKEMHDTLTVRSRLYPVHFVFGVDKATLTLVELQKTYSKGSSTKLKAGNYRYSIWAPGFDTVWGYFMIPHGKEYDGTNVTLQVGQPKKISVWFKINLPGAEIINWFSTAITVFETRADGLTKVQTGSPWNLEVGKEYRIVAKATRIISGRTYRYAGNSNLIVIEDMKNQRIKIQVREL